MNIEKYSKTLKMLSIVPILVGLLTFTETLLPYKTMETEVVSKDTNYRTKTNRTTFTIDFIGINDQFTYEIFSQLEPSDKVLIYYTYFNKQIRAVTRLRDHIQFFNSTNEEYAILGFALFFLLAGLVWFDKIIEKNPHLFFGIASIATFLGFISGLRMLFA